MWGAVGTGGDMRGVGDIRGVGGAVGTMVWCVY